MSELSVRDHLKMERMFIQLTKEQQDSLLEIMQRLLSTPSSMVQEMRRLVALWEEVQKMEKSSKPSSLRKHRPSLNFLAESKRVQPEDSVKDLMGDVFGFGQSMPPSIRYSKVQEPS